MFYDVKEDYFMFMQVIVRFLVDNFNVCEGIVVGVVWIFVEFWQEFVCYIFFWCSGNFILVVLQGINF